MGFATNPVLIGLLLAASFVSAPASAAEMKDRAGEIETYEPWCGGPKPLMPCVDEIIRVDQELVRREQHFKQTGEGYNYGNSLRGCQIYCILRHFPHDTPQECPSTIVTFKRAARAKPYLWKADLRQLLKKKCGAF